MASISELIRKSGANTTETEERPKSKFWLNVYLDVGQGKKLYLPRGIALSGVTAKEMPTGKASAEFKAQRAAEAQLWASIEQFLETLQPGQVEEMTDLHVEIRRIEESTETEAASTENGFSSAVASFASKLGSKK